MNTDQLWEALKRQCCSTKPGTPEWDKVSRIVMVSKKDIAAVLKNWREEQEEEKCPFSDPKFELDLDEPCPVCGMLGDINAEVLCIDG